MPRRMNAVLENTRATAVVARFESGEAMNAQSRDTSRQIVRCTSQRKSKSCGAGKGRQSERSGSLAMNRQSKAWFCRTTPASDANARRRCGGLGKEIGTVPGNNRQLGHARSGARTRATRSPIGRSTGSRWETPRTVGVDDRNSPAFIFSGLDTAVHVARMSAHVRGWLGCEYM